MENNKKPTTISSIGNVKGNPTLPENGGYNTYVGARYVPVVYGEWKRTVSYEPLTIVSYQGNSYTSKTYVPANIDITNETYWVKTADYNTQVEYYRQEVEQAKEDIDESEARYKQDMQTQYSTFTSDTNNKYNQFKNETNNTIESFKNETNEKIDEYKDEIDESEQSYKAEIAKQVATLEGGKSTPKFANSTSDMIDHNVPYVNTTDNYIYYYNGREWTSTGIQYGVNTSSLVKTAPTKALPNQYDSLLSNLPYGSIFHVDNTGGIKWNDFPLGISDGVIITFDKNIQVMFGLTLSQVYCRNNSGGYKTPYGNLWIKNITGSNHNQMNTAKNHNFIGHGVIPNRNKNGTVIAISSPFVLLNDAGQLTKTFLCIEDTGVISIAQQSIEYNTGSIDTDDSRFPSNFTVLHKEGLLTKTLIYLTRTFHPDHFNQQYVFEDKHLPAIYLPGMCEGPINVEMFDTNNFPFPISLNWYEGHFCRENNNDNKLTRDHVPSEVHDYGYSKIHDFVYNQDIEAQMSNLITIDHYTYRSTKPVLIIAKPIFTHYFSGFGKYDGANFKPQDMNFPINGRYVRLWSGYGDDKTSDIILWDSNIKNVYVKHQNDSSAYSNWEQITKPNQEIWFFGDSTTKGEIGTPNTIGNIIGNAKRDWPTIVCDELNATKVNKAVGGQSFLKDWDTVQGYINDYNMNNARLVLLCWSYNETDRGEYNLGDITDITSESYLGKVYTLMKQFQEKCPKASIAWVTGYGSCHVDFKTYKNNFNSKDLVFKDGTYSYADVYNKIEELCNYYGWCCINQAKGSWVNQFTWKTLISDNIHPNELGYHVYGNFMAGKIHSIFANRQLVS